MTTTALVPRPAPLAATRASSLHRGRRLGAAALVVAALSIPLTGTGRAIAADHAPAHVKVAAIADSVVGPVATGKHDV